MNLEELITALEATDPNRIVARGFSNPHSYRGDYMDLAFEPATDIRVGEMLDAARSALGATFQGWKGGEFTMGGHSWCWLSQEGDASGETISALLVELLLAPAAVSVVPPATNQTAEEHRLALSEALGLGTGAPWDAIHDRAKELAAEAPQTGATASCGCGEPATLGTVHRADGPCYVDDRRESIALAIARVDAGKWGTEVPLREHPMWQAYLSYGDAVLAMLTSTRKPELRRLAAEAPHAETRDAEAECICTEDAWPPHCPCQNDTPPAVVAQPGKETSS